MNIADWIKKATRQLEAADIGTARLDAMVLLEDISGKDRAWLLANPDAEISAANTTQLKKLLIRREQHEPLAYLRNKTEFYGRDFYITSAVLEPRPESETMIDLLKKLPGLSNPHGPLMLADVGTGSGALGITAALEVPNLRVELLDIDREALKIAKTNVDLFTLTINTTFSDLLNSSAQKNDILLSNLPYVPDAFHINPAAQHEPKIALFGGPDGLDLYRKLFDQVAKLDKQPLYILIESMPPQHPVMLEVAAKVEYKLCQSEDFIQVFEKQ